jgi:hypothetical protein
MNITATVSSAKAPGFLIPDPWSTSPWSLGPSSF